MRTLCLAEVLIFDNGPQFTSEVFERFTWKYNICHQSSRKRRESQIKVKTAKLLIKKATDDNADAFLELLAHHNPPQKNFDKSPAQRMFAVAAGRPYLPFLYYYSST